MMKSLLRLSMVLVAGMLLTQSAFAQGIGINTTGANPDPSAILDASSVTQGFLPPRMTSEQRDAIVSPAPGLTIYNTTTNCENYFNSTNWVELCENVMFSPIVATGGTVSTYTADGTNGVAGVIYKVHSYTTVGNSSFIISDFGSSGQVDYLIVAGGGGGAIQHAGGGGGGGVVYNTNVIINDNNISITVGSGGINNPNLCHNCGYQGATGANSVFGSIIAHGGGGGSGWSETNSGNGLNGGSGGGGGVGRNSSGFGGTGTVGQGFAGGNGFPHGSGGIPYRGTGGGGAGGLGGNMGSTNGANGGVGILNYITGTAKYYGGGGGGGVYGSGGQAGNGGTGGGGSGGAAAGATNASIGATGNASGANGEVNTGGGGGSSGQWEVAGGNGGSGIVIIRYPITNPNL